MTRFEMQPRLRVLAILLSAAPLLSGCSQFFVLFGLEDSAGFVALPSLNASPSPPAPLSCDANIENGYGGGDGTPATPYTLCSQKHWDHFASQDADWGSSFRLESDLDFSGVALLDFKMIGSVANPFTGEFDGDGHEIRNIELVAATVPVALFLQTDGSAKIRDLSLKSIELDTTSRAAVLVLDHEANGKLSLENIALQDVSIKAGLGSSAMLVAASEGGVAVRNIAASASVLDYGGGQSAGFFGVITGAVEVENVTISDMSLTGDFMSSSYSGSVAGTLLAGGVIKNALIEDLVLDAGWATSGVVGRSYGPIDFERVRVFGTVDGGGGQSGIIGEAGGMVVPADVRIIESSFEGTLVNAGNTSYGGLAGVLFDSAVIQRSYFSGQASVWSGVFGGLVGNAAYAGTTLLIEDSYAVGNWTTTHATQGVLSGLIGNVPTAGGDVTLRRSFYAGAFGGTATPKKSCVLSYTSSNSLTVEDVYFDSTLCSHPADHDTVIAGTTAVATAVLQPAAALPNWQPTVWRFVAGQYPKHVWQD